MELLLWDADSLCYLGTEGDSISTVFGKVDIKIKEVLEYTKVDYFKLFLSKGPYFRNELPSVGVEYKGNRTAIRKYKNIIKEYLISEYNAYSYPKLEADDLVVYFNNCNIYIEDGQIKSTGAERVKTIIASNDKDLIYSVPGTHIIPTSKNKELNTWEVAKITTTKETSDTYNWVQMVSGDVADNIKGLTNKGPAWCKKQFAGLTINQIASLVLSEYIEEYGEYKGILNFNRNYLMLNLLDNKDKLNVFIKDLPKLDTVNPNLFKSIF